MQRIPDEFLSEVSGGGVIKTAAGVVLGTAIIFITKFTYDVYNECQRQANSVGGILERGTNILLGTNDIRHEFSHRTPYKKAVYETSKFIVDLATDLAEKDD